MYNSNLVKMKTNILVTAANGNTGFPVAKELLNLGFAVRAIVRNPKSKTAVELKSLGAEIFIGDLNDVRDIKNALKGVQRAYFCSPFGRNTLAQQVAFVSAAEEAELEHVVYMSQWLAMPEHPALNTREQWLGDQMVKLHKNVKYTLVNPGLFEFMNYFTVETIAQLGLMPTIVKNAANSINVGLNASPSENDQGRVIAHILKDPVKHTGKTYRITGPKLLSPKEMADIFGKILKRKVKIMEISDNMLLKSGISLGLSKFYVSHFLYYMQELDKGGFAVNGVTNVVKDITGSDPEDFETMARRRLATLPEAKKSFSNKLKAIRNFIGMLFTSVPNIEKFELEQEIPKFINGHNYAQENKEWLRIHKNQSNK